MRHFMTSRAAMEFPPKGIETRPFPDGTSLPREVRLYNGKYLVHTFSVEEQIMGCKSPRPLRSTVDRLSASEKPTLRSCNTP